MAGLVWLQIARFDLSPHGRVHQRTGRQEGLRLTRCGIDVNCAPLLDGLSSVRGPLGLLVAVTVHIQHSGQVLLAAFCQTGEPIMLKQTAS